MCQIQRHILAEFGAVAYKGEVVGVFGKEIEVNFRRKRIIPAVWVGADIGLVPCHQQKILR